jgi:hypothetical protein
MTENVDWELKDRRIAWMNINSACSTILAARITSGLYKPKNNKEAIAELLDAIDIEFQSFLNIGSSSKVVKSETPKPVSSGKFYCTICNKEVSEKVKDYSERKFGKPLCYECQNETPAE